MTTTMDDVSRVSSVAESIKSDALQKFPEAASVGDTFRQGDIYITLLSGLPVGCSQIKNPAAQIAPGNTQGSRHCLSSLRGARLYLLPSANVYDGPVLDLNRKTTIAHPEHGDVVLPPGCYAISFQRTEDSEGRQRRVQD